MRNPLKLTTTILLGLGIAGTASWLTTGRLIPEAHAHSTPADIPHSNGMRNVGLR